MMERYAAYKDSGIEWIGEIPEKWDKSALRWVFVPVKRQPLDDDEIITCFRDGEVTLRKNRREDGFTMSDKEIGYQHIKHGDLIIHGMDGFAGAIGISDVDGKASPVLMAFEMQDGMENRYYKYLLLDYALRDIFLSLSTTIRVRSCDLNWSKIASIPLLVPPMGEQSAIAKYLDAKTAEIDELIADQEKSIELLQEYRKAVISEAVTKGLDPDVPMKDSGIDWIGKCPISWKLCKQKNVMRFINGRAYRQNELLSDGKYAVLRVGNFNTNDSWYYSNLELEPEKYCEAGDLLYLWATTFGPEIWHGDRVIFHYHIWKIEHLDVLRRRFLYYWLRASAAWLELQSHGSTMVHITKEGMEQEIIAIPTLIEQQAIVDYLDSKTAGIDSLLTDKRQLIDKLKEYRKSLISEAVTGKFKVPGVA